MYTSINFQTKKAFKQAVVDGKEITLFSPGLGVPKVNGVETVEGPQYPQPHKWYASVKVENGIVVKIL